MNEKKLTKKDYFEAIAAVVTELEDVNGIPAQDVLAFIDKQVEQIDNKAEKAKAKAAEKKAEGDALRDKVEAALTDELQSAEALVEAIGEEDVTKQKVVARLTQLVNAGIATKEKVKVDKAEKTMYRKA